MSTSYVVLRQLEEETRTDYHGVCYAEVNRAEAANAQQACRHVAEQMDDKSLAGGVTLVAVPARNWASGRNTFAAKTERKLIRS